MLSHVPQLWHRSASLGKKSWLTHARNIHKPGAVTAAKMSWVCLLSRDRHMSRERAGRSTRSLGNILIRIIPVHDLIFIMIFLKGCGTSGNNLDFWNQLKPDLWCVKTGMEKEEGWRTRGAGLLTDSTGRRHNTPHRRRKPLTVFWAAPAQQWEWEPGAVEGRIKRQQESIPIKSTAGKSALAGTGLSLQISMNWEGETAQGTMWSQF